MMVPHFSDSVDVKFVASVPGISACLWSANVIIKVREWVSIVFSLRSKLLS